MSLTNALWMVLLSWSLLHLLVAIIGMQAEPVFTTELNCHPFCPLVFSSNITGTTQHSGFLARGTSACSLAPNRWLQVIQIDTCVTWTYCCNECQMIDQCCSQCDLGMNQYFMGIQSLVYVYVE